MAESTQGASYILNPRILEVQSRGKMNNHNPERADLLRTALVFLPFNTHKSAEVTSSTFFRSILKSRIDASHA